MRDQAEEERRGEKKGERRDERESKRERAKERETGFLSCLCNGDPPRTAWSLRAPTLLVGGQPFGHMRPAGRRGGGRCSFPPFPSSAPFLRLLLTRLVRRRGNLQAVWVRKGSGAARLPPGWTRCSRAASVVTLGELLRGGADACSRAWLVVYLWRACVV